MNETKLLYDKHKAAVHNSFPNVDYMITAECKIIVDNIVYLTTM